ncbi:MAG: hypothetical protein COB85_03895 [Bacteroidetes bacterium]|nr:MAG: hypothetical protein COB85_03895 [Bacteroidota bacterium]
MIKSVFTIGVVVLIGHTALSAESEKAVSSQIKDVTVYLNGAEINRSGNTSLNAGDTYVLFEGLSPNIDANTVQVKGKGNFTILSVVHRLNHLNQSEKPKDILALEDSLESLQMRRDFQNALQSVYNNEEAMILANKSIGNKDVGVDAMDLSEVADLFRKRLTEIQLKKLEAKATQKKLRRRLDIIVNQLNSLNAKRNRSTSEIIVAVNAGERTPAKFTLTYYVSGAGWTPTYDLRATKISEPVQLDYKAKVHQSSGVDWNKVNLTLSASNPTRSGSKPSLNTWVLKYGRHGYYRASSQNKKGVAPMAMSSRLEMEEVIIYKDKLIKAETTADYTTVSKNQVSTEFKISIPYTIPSDAKAHDVHVQSHKVKATFMHFVVPKLDKDAFLVAKITGWEEYNLLPGKANIYFDGSYVGKSNINPNATTDTLSLSFGRDKNVVVTREKLKDFTSTKIIGANRKITYAYEIVVRNTKSEAISIEVQDQYPISSNKEIEIELIESAEANLDKVSGKLSWKLNLAPTETKKMMLIYSVKYPKDKSIPNL